MDELRFWMKLQFYLKRVPLTAEEMSDFVPIWNAVEDAITKCSKPKSEFEEVKKNA